MELHRSYISLERATRCVSQRVDQLHGLVIQLLQRLNSFVPILKDQYPGSSDPLALA